MKTRDTPLPKVIFGLGIANIGLANAKMICKSLSYDIHQLLRATPEALSAIDGVGDVIAQAFVEYFAQPRHIEEFESLLKELRIRKESPVTEEQIFSGVNFVITGSVEHYANRGEVKEVIEAKGGKVTGSVTSKTNYLINNDAMSSSSKNKKAKELGIPIISEADFLKLLQGNS